MRTLGMIGGTSWYSTVEYYEFINKGVGKEIGTQGNPELIIHSINIELMRSRDWEGERRFSPYKTVLSAFN